MIAAQVVFFIEDSNRSEEGERLAKALSLPIVNNFSKSEIVLALTYERLELRFPQEKIKPIAVDFCSKEAAHRLASSKGKKELIARAVGIKSGYFPSVIDTTAGLGEDSMVLAYLGCDVKMVERSPIICALLADGLIRAKSQLTWINHLELTCQDARIFLQHQIQHQQLPDVVYLDPMFPPRTKSALVKKEMRILKRIVGEDKDAEALFNLAKTCAKKRVVVKRPRHAPLLTEDKPSHSYLGRACRFDVYLNPLSAG